MKYQILLVEDDVQIREVITDYFTGQPEDEMQVICASDGEEGMEKIAEQQFDLVLLDIMLPKTNGFELCRLLRKNSIVPVIFLTARGQEEDKLYGYNQGCDDYMVKPFSLAELYAKVKALLKRAKGMVMYPVLSVGAVELNPSRHTVMVKDKPIKLAPKEYELLKYLMEHKHITAAREELLIHVWGYDYEGSDRVVDNHIKKLRKLLGPGGSQIKTVITKGYRMEEE